MEKYKFYWARKFANFFGTNFPIGKDVLDLEKVEMFGFQHDCSIEVLASISEGIKNGDDIPLVDVVKSGDLKYEIVYGWERNVICSTRYGGHHRSVAHFIDREPLGVRIFEKHRDSYMWRFRVKIEDIVLIDDRDRLDRNKKKDFYREY